jgi:Fe2+ transport system protein FeoA
MSINEAPVNKKLRVLSFRDDESREFSDLESRLMHLGFMDGAQIRIARKVSLFSGPYLVEVRGRYVALTAEEAELVLVEVSE